MPSLRDAWEKLEDKYGERNRAFTIGRCPSIADGKGARFNTGNGIIFFTNGRTSGVIGEMKIFVERGVWIGILRHRRAALRANAGHISGEIVATFLA